MAIVIQLEPEKEARIRARAAAYGQEVGDYLVSVAERQDYDPTAAIALLDAFAHSDDYGTEQEQRETLEYLERVVDLDRPGQRSIFGVGFNPPADLNAQVLP